MLKSASRGQRNIFYRGNNILLENHSRSNMKDWLYWSQELPFGSTGQRLGFPGGSDGKEFTCNEGDLSLIPGSGRSPGEENGNPLQHSWRISWTEEPGELATVRYRPWGRRVGHEGVTNTHCQGNSRLTSWSPALNDSGKWSKCPNKNKTARRFS